MDEVPDNCAKSLVLLVFVCVCVFVNGRVCVIHACDVCTCTWLVGDYVIVCMKGGGEC